jgi:RNA polymerase sigma-70 factor (ECF subfamily)
MTRTEIGGEVCRETFGEVYRAHRRTVWAFVRARVGDYQLAEDVVQETFLKAWNHADEFVARGGGVGAWLCTIARNVIYDLPKRGHRKYELLARADVDGTVTAHDPVDPDLDPAELAVRLEDNARVNRVLAEQRLAILRLSEDQCEAMLYRHIDGLSTETTAALMGKSVGAVKALCGRGISKLTDRLRLPGDDRE